MAKAKKQKKVRKIPMRKDLLTNEMKPKKEMVRIVRDPDGIISIDPTGKKSGRGAYVSLAPDAIAAAKKGRYIEKALAGNVTENFYDELYAYVDHRKARVELFGPDA
ncbi:RNase P modulator RnpM [Schleiferilactobacillus shenzhenensis]|uniref:YlxR n=1 Tax=Schleiferilactobacillus shenzhenensis LY-73 TaxID=1231336 RepID=U4TSN9_9LACO|nr:YlxR family protein [Schleiferilactobacillus shenzhenensis]ERL64497.1 YlxR [Schleiferilactobacillus shenzhenensis LY-73]